MGEKGLVEIVCNQQLTEAYCVKGSAEHKRMSKNGKVEGIRLIKIPSYRLPGVFYGGDRYDGKTGIDIDLVL